MAWLRVSSSYTTRDKNAGTLLSSWR